MRVEVLSAVERQRQWSDEEKFWIVEETLVPGARVADCSTQHSERQSVFGWRRLARDSVLWTAGVPALVPVEIVAPTLVPSVAEMSRPTPRATRSAGVIEIELGHWRRVWAGRDVDGDALRRVLNVLDRVKIASLHEALEGEDAATARDHVRALIDEIRLFPEDPSMLLRIELRGELAAQIRHFVRGAYVGAH